MSTPTAEALEDLARSSLADVAPEHGVGEVLAVDDRGDGVTDVALVAAQPGYVGWRWTVSIAQVDDAEPTVLEVGLLPGDGALVAPPWVPWAERLAEYRRLHPDESIDDLVDEDVDDLDDEADDGDADEDDVEDADDGLDEADDLDGVDFETADESDDAGDETADDAGDETGDDEGSAEGADHDTEHVDETVHPEADPHVVDEPATDLAPRSEPAAG